jgi:ribosomal-protein-alanine N-acetyltransferase
MRFLLRFQPKKSCSSATPELPAAKPERVGRVVLREMRLEEVEDAVVIEAKSFPDPWGYTLFRTELENPFSKGLVAHFANETRILGYSLFWAMFEEIHILNFAIDPTFRRLGIGELLLKKSIAIGKELGAEKATLEVRTSNMEAIRLYEKLGFRIAGERPRYYARTNENAYIMLLPDFNRLEL